MRRAPDTPSRSRWRLAVLVTMIAVLGGVSWWVWAGRQPPPAQAPAVCADCGHECEVEVGVTPSLEQWPRECPSCKKKSLYLGVQCRRCKKLIPMRDPATDRHGTPDQCPWCKSFHRES